MDTQTARTVREEFVLPQVADVIEALAAAGATVEEACRAIRWATYRIEGR